MENCSGALDVKLCFISIDLKSNREFRCHVGQLQNQVCGSDGSKLAASLKPLPHLVCLSVYYLFYFRR